MRFGLISYQFTKSCNDSAIFMNYLFHTINIYKQENP